ncbi:trichohyalin-like [Mytilus californianus]|uniref:trichohyalin-like n=1 Tax=Mytilus californianus TaxID=6549 RepID=UPI00224704BC|nr:trichohyalin-like [Mytilus californianus]
MPVFYVPASETPKKQHRLQQQYSIDERKLMSDILYEDLSSKRSTVKFDRDERRLIAEITRQKDLESKVEQSKQFDEKRQQNLAKRDEIEAEKKARAQEKLRRSLSTTKPDLVSETVKRYETKRSEVLERIQKKEKEKKAKLDKAMNREKPNFSTLVTKIYDEKRAGVLERIQKKQEETKLKYEQKINKAVPDKSAMIPDIAKSYDNRRAEVLARLKQSEDEKKMKIEKKLERVENAHQRYKENMLFIREKSVMGRTFDFDNIKEGSAQSSDDEKNDQDSGISLNKSYQDTDSQGDSCDSQQSTNRSKSRLMSSYGSFSKRSVLPPIE